MTELTDRITPEMSEEEVLGVILDEIMERAEPDVAKAIRFCAIPHWFNEEIIAWLRGEGLGPSQRSREILAALTELTFVGPYHERGWAYHENVRDLLLRRWREGDGEEFKELSGRAADYFGQKAEEATDEERDEWMRELMYHLLVADEGEGYELLQSMFDEASKFYRLSTCSLLLQLAGEVREYLSEEHQQWLRYCEGRLAYKSARWDEALEFFETLLKEELVDKLEGDVVGEAGVVYYAKGEWERAIKYYERSLAINEMVGNEYGMAVIFSNLGSVYRARRKWEQAIEYYERSLTIKEKEGDEHGMAPTLNNLGSVYYAKGEWELATKYYKRSLAITQKIGDERMMAFSYNNIAMLYQDQSRLEEAVPLFEKSLEIFERIGDEPHADHVRGNLEKARQELEAKKGQG
jgi:tetratricopeptide (TPR) repeat protein